MRKTSDIRKRQASHSAMRRQYRFDYRRAKPNRFADKMAKDAVVVVLEPDVAARFKSSEAVNTLLRSVLSAMPEV